ncbi:MAG TPA: cytochrome C oxidase subunit IV family protein [Steroidobacteraceae bacterium]|nr:cytochrome C oxidase subunit IV family protein [Steroidobacteraceae bacterium]
MSDQENAAVGSHQDTNFEIGDSTHVQSYMVGLAFAIILTLASFGLARTHLVWGPGMPILLAVLAIAQMGVHLVFFMHVNATEEGENTALALGFGIFIVFLVVFGSMIIMNNLSGSMPTMEQLMKMQR